LERSGNVMTSAILIGMEWMGCAADMKSKAAACLMSNGILII